MGESGYRAVWARRIAARTTAAPASWTALKVSRSQAQATIVATTGSSMAAIPTRVAVLDLVLGEQEVQREDHRGDQREHDAEPVERDALPELDHQREPRQRQRERSPDPASHMLVAERARVDRDEQRAEILDQERD